MAPATRGPAHILSPARLLRPPQVYLKMELCSESLRDRFKRGEPFRDADAIEVLRQARSAGVGAAQGTPASLGAEQNASSCVSRAALACAQMASALAAVHGLDMVHLDVKPDNIYVGVPPRHRRVLPGAEAASQPRASNSGTPGGSGGSGGVLYKLGDFGLAMLQGGRLRAGTSEGDSR
jgi:serine/threonine protein kinase